MKTVRLQNNVVWEILPDDAIPLEDYYPPEFLAHCVEAPDNVEQGFLYDPETDTFSSPPEPEPEEPKPDYDAFLDGLMEGYNHG